MTVRFGRGRPKRLENNIKVLSEGSDRAFGIRKTKEGMYIVSTYFFEETRILAAVSSPPLMFVDALIELQHKIRAEIPSHFGTDKPVKA